MNKVVSAVPSRGRFRIDSLRCWCLLKTWRSVLVVSALLGALLGFGDLLLQKSLPYPWANLANSSAVWALAAFMMGAWASGGWLRAAVAGVVLLVVAVETYYVAAALVQNDDLANGWSTTSLTWLALALLAGLVFGVTGAWSRHRRRILRFSSYASLSAVFILESLLILGRSTNNSTAANHLELFYTASLEAGLSLAVPTILFLRNRNRYRREAHRVIALSEDTRR
jgi:uncharacterized membrane protein YjjB (DUF3815 family)